MNSARTNAAHPAGRLAFAALWGAVILFPAILAPAQQPATAPAIAPTTSPTTVPAVEDPEKYVAMGQERLKAGNPSEALVAFRRALSLDDTLVEAQLGAARAATALRNADALLYFEKGAGLCIRTGDLARAERTAREAADAFPVHPITLRIRAGVSVAAGRAKLAIDDYTQYLQTDIGRTDTLARLALADIYLGQKFPRLAISVLQKAQQLDSANAEVMAALARAYLETREGNLALTQAERAVRTDPGRLAYHDLYARVLAALRRLDGAGGAEEAAMRGIAIARERLTRTPGDLTLLQEASRLYETAQAILNERLNRTPNDVKLLLDLAQLREDAATVARSIGIHNVLSLVTQASRIAPNDLNILRRKAMLESQLGLIPAAIATCRRILELEPNDPDVQKYLRQFEQPATQTAPAR